MSIRLSLADLLVAMAVVAGMISFVWFGRKAHQLEPKLSEMRELAGELTISNKTDIHAIGKPTYGLNVRSRDWELYLPNRPFRLCFAEVNATNQPLSPVRSFPVTSGKSRIKVTWTKSELHAERDSTRTPAFHTVEFFQDDVSIASVNNLLPAIRIDFGPGQPHSYQNDVTLKPGAKLFLKTFQQMNEDYVVSKDSPKWSVWIEPAE